jgi:rhodanese-related sulfurtransferase
MNVSQTAMITPQEAAQQQSAALLLDVRTPAEFEESHIEGAVLHPLHELHPGHVEKLLHNKVACFIICGSGNRAQQAAVKLAAAGITSLRVLEGGMKAWRQQGLPVISGKKTISLERQVRIAAGTLVVMGAALALFVNPVWVALCAFVGAGLVFAGITDTCGLALILAKMPWNNRTRACGTKYCCSA